MAIHNQSFRIEDLATGKLSKDNFQVNKLPLWKFLDEMDRKLASKGGLSSVPLKEVLEAAYEYGVITVGLDRADLEQRVENLNAKNLELFVKCDSLQLENEKLKQLLQEKQSFKEN